MADVPARPVDSPLTARAADRVDSDLLGRFFSEFLDESAFAEFRRVERLVERLRAQGLTRSGYPVIRPADCGRIIASLETIFEQAEPHFRTRDPVMTARFEDLIAGFSAFCQKVYPAEAAGALLLHGRVRLFMGDADGALDLVSHHALRPYAVEGSAEVCVRFVETFAQAHLQRGTLAQLGISFVALGAWLARHGECGARRAAVRMAPFIGLAAPDAEVGRMPALIRWLSGRYLDLVKGRGRPLWRGWALVRAWGCGVLMGLCYRWLARMRPTVSPFSMRRNPRGTTLVTRAMGGIGDLLMMTPGLAALARRQKAPVDFAIPRRFHAIFANNPHVRLLDIDGAVIDMTRYRAWSNLSLCPAGRYESRTRPKVRKGRVELFARAMRVTRAMLDRQGWRIDHHLSAGDVRFCDAFMARHGLAGERRLIGIQPFSRDSYKDHARIDEIIAAIAVRHDVLIFHHVADGLPVGPGIHTTAGVPLDRSLGLVSRVDAMVCVDSAFLHAAAAFDVPVVALFGPTDPRTFTRHHRKVKILWKPEVFGCVPCWRNEDIACAVTGLRSMSPCIAAITQSEVIAALDEVME